MSSKSDMLDTKVETGLLRALFTDPDAYREVSNQGLQPIHFLSAEYREVFGEMQELRRKGLAITPLSVSVISANHHKTVQEIMACLDPPLSNLGDYAKIITLNAAKRKLLGLSQKIVKAIADDKPSMEHDTAVLYVQMEPLIRVLNAHKQQSGVELALEKIMGRITGEIEDDSTFGTGLSRVNKLLDGGLRRTDLTIIAGRTGQGKTAIAVSMLHYMSVVRGLPCVMYSYEMSPEQVLQRMMAIDSGVALKQIRLGQHKDPAYEFMYPLDRLVESHGRIGTRFKEGTLDIISAAGWTIDEIVADVMARSKKSQLAMVCIDYLQLVREPEHLRTANRATQVAYSTGEAKQLAEKANINVLGLSQLNRGVEYRTGEPMLSDLRESGAIEQDANQVMFVFDPGANEFGDLRSGCPPDYSIKVIDLQKNRNGECGRIPIFYRGCLTQFVDWPDGEQPGGSQQVSMDA